MALPIPRELPVTGLSKQGAKARKIPLQRFLIDTTIDLFLDYGFNGTTVDRIAEVALDIAQLKICIEMWRITLPRYSR